MKPSEFTKKKIQLLWKDYHEKGGSQISLGKACGVAQAQISIWLTGRIPKADGLAALAKGFRVPVWEFFPPESIDLTVKQRELLAQLPSLEDDQVDTIFEMLGIENDPSSRLVNKKLSKKRPGGE